MNWEENWKHKDTTCCWLHAIEQKIEVCWYILCPNCGNKRCPKASDCSLECTNSNEAGQPGSIYVKFQGTD